MTLANIIDFSRVTDSEGIAIAVTGMFIVFAALSLITVFIFALPHLLAVVSKVLPETVDKHAVPDRSEGLLPNEPVLAAIGFVLHTEIQKQLETNRKSS